MATIEERYGCIDCNLASCEGCDAFLLVKGATEQKAIDKDHFREVKKMLIDKDHKAFVELLQVQYGEYCDESMHQYIDDALTKAMEE